MGYGLPAALGVQAAHPGALVVDIAGEASVQMTMQEMSTAVQHRLPIKVVRIFNTYGPRQSARAVIPTIIAQIASGEPNSSRK